jgi:S-DNA-T family DNA segregation ATPase FtsK/SpoIIIE
LSNQKQQKNAGGSARSQSKTLGKNASSGKSGGQGNKKHSQKVSAAGVLPERKPLLGARVRNDLVGLAIAIVAVVLLAIILLPSDAIGAQFVSEALRLVFGLGTFLLPILLLGWSTSFFVRRRLTNSPLRLVIGLAVIYLGLISLFATFTPLAASAPERIFDPAVLTGQGGYVGGAVAWVLLSLVGSVAAIIILVGLMLAGLVLIGLSITGLVDWLIQRVGSTAKRNEFA